MTTYRIEWRLLPKLRKPFHLDGDANWGRVRQGLQRLPERRVKTELSRCRLELGYQYVRKSKALGRGYRLRMFEFRAVKNNNQQTKGKT